MGLYQLVCFCWLTIFVDHEGFGYRACGRFFAATREAADVPSFEIEIPGDYADDACLVIAEL
jgi:hypothetical protein